jgi:hypothetical protein
MKQVLHPDVIARSGRVEDYVMLYRKRSGAIRALARTYVTPYNPQSDFQQRQRSVFGAAQAGWAALTATVREAWEECAKTFYNSQLDPNTGQNFAMTGQQLYVSAQILALSQSGGALGTTAPVDEPVQTPVFPTGISAVSATGVITITHSGVDDTANARVRVTPDYTAGYADRVGDLRNPFTSGNEEDNWDAAVDLSADDIVITMGAAFVNMRASLIPTTLDYILVEILLSSETDNLPPVTGPARRQLQITVT